MKQIIIITMIAYAVTVSAPRSAPEWARLSMRASFLFAYVSIMIDPPSLEPAIDDEQPDAGEDA